MEVIAYAAGAGVLVVLWAASGLLSRRWTVFGYFIGSDGRPSTSKAQWFMWTAAVLFSYPVIYVARAQTGHYEPLQDIPTNVLVAVGLSAATMATAKAITYNQVATGRLAKTPGGGGLSALIQDDQGFPDLSKLQMMAWTVLAIAVYLAATVNEVHTFSMNSSNKSTGLPQIPDIGGALMALMGLGQGGYIAKKLTPPGAAIIPATVTPAGNGSSEKNVQTGQRPAGWP